MLKGVRGMAERSVNPTLVTLHFFDDIYIPPSYLMQPCGFDREDGVWYWEWKKQVD